MEPAKLRQKAFGQAALHPMACDRLAAALSSTLVADFKSRFFASAWAHYETARSKTLKLRPSAAREAELERDYKRMEPMFMATPPPFSHVLKVLGNAERDLHSR